MCRGARISAIDMRDVERPRFEHHAVNSHGAGLYCFELSLSALFETRLSTSESLAHVRLRELAVDACPIVVSPRLWIALDRGMYRIR